MASSRRCARRAAASRQTRWRHSFRKPGPPPTAPSRKRSRNLPVSRRFDVVILSAAKDLLSLLRKCEKQVLRCAQDDNLKKGGEMETGKELVQADYFISTDKSKLDVRAIHAYLSESSYWAQDRSLATVEKS